jgi:SAM-dependent methyltransferase
MVKEDFYHEVLRELLGGGVLATSDSILVVCGGPRDRETLLACGFQNVVISNLDERLTGNEFSPYAWSVQNAESLTYEDGSFDFVVVHSGLHHCASPHRGLLEMYRVSRAGIVLFEPYDNLLTRLAVKLKFGQEFEHSAVYYDGGSNGGLHNTAIPNYIYRLTRDEIVKTVTCFAPYGKHTFRFIHRMRPPTEQLRGRRNKLFYYALLATLPVLRMFEALCPGQSNNFAAVVLKPQVPRDLYPWIRMTDTEMKLDQEWLRKHYGSAE